MSDSENLERDGKESTGDDKKRIKDDDDTAAIPLDEPEELSSDESESFLVPIEQEEKGEEKDVVGEKVEKVILDESEELEIEEILGILKDPIKSESVEEENLEIERDLEEQKESVADSDESEDDPLKEVVIEVKEQQKSVDRTNYESIGSPSKGLGEKFQSKGESSEESDDENRREGQSSNEDEITINETRVDLDSEEEDTMESSLVRRRIDNAENTEEDYEIVGEEQEAEDIDDEDSDEEKKVLPQIPFGISPWYRNPNEKPVKDEKVSNLRGGMVRKLRNAIKLPPKILFAGNIIYVIFFGWYMALIYILAGILCYVSICCIPQGKVMFQMSSYFFWPFNKYVERTGNKKRRKDNYRKVFSQAAVSCPFLQEEVSIFVFQIFFAPILALWHAYCMIIAWFGIVTISISKLHFHGMKMMLLNPLNYRVRYLKRIHPGSHIYLCVFRCIRFSYIKYSVFGMNIFMLNLLPLIIVTIFLGLIDEEFAKKYAFLIFPMGLLSTIPLAYYIGKAVSSISSQSSFAVGAFFNALFGSLIELILYFIQLSKGLTGTVHKAVTGSLLGVMLLMPGLSMFIGGIKHRQQYFNKDAAGVSAVLLLLAISGVFVPTLFYETIAEFGFRCQICTNNVTLINGGFDCTGCIYHSPDQYQEDRSFQNRAKPLTWVVGFILPVAYIAGLIFALKTHKHLYEKPVKDEEGLELEAGLFAAIAEVISITMEPGVEMIGISKEFAGLTLIGIIPNVAEFVNAIQFSLENNIILSLEIGNVAALQISLLQTSALVLISQVLYGWIFSSMSDSVYYLIFPRMDMYALFLAVLVLNYVMIDGRANYFRGLVLVLVYLIFTAAYFFETQNLGDE